LINCSNKQQELYVISNRDVDSMSILDQWLHYIDTEEVLPLFEKIELDYTTPKLATLHWEKHSELIRSVCRDNNLSSLRRMNSITELREILNLLKEHNEKTRLRDVFSQALSLAEDSTCTLDGRSIVSALLQYLQDAPYLTSTLLQSQSWKRHKQAIEDELLPLAPIIAKRLVLASNEFAGFVLQPLSLLLHELKRLSMQSFAELVELIALTVRSTDAALDLFLEVLEPETSRLLVGRPAAIRQFTSSLFGIALDHIEEAESVMKPEPESIKLTVDEYKDGYTNLKSILRVDSSMAGTLKVGDHVRLNVPNAPQNDPLARLFSMDALVLSAESGTIIYRCLHDPPSYVTQCAWNISLCGSFVTSKTSLDAVMTFYTEREACCRIYASVLGLSAVDQIEIPNVDLPANRDSTLNTSQNDALIAAMKHSLTLIWGPPGTGKTYTIIVILCQLLRQLPKSRFLVTAPTHNAVDNILRRFVNDDNAKELGIAAVRVSTQVS
jgi:Cdc6-like AAA superfamily ATPase